MLRTPGRGSTQLREERAGAALATGCAAQNRAWFISAGERVCHPRLNHAQNRLCTPAAGTLSYRASWGGSQSYHSGGSTGLSQVHPWEWIAWLRGRCAPAGITAPSDQAHPDPSAARVPSGLRWNPVGWLDGWRCGDALTRPRFRPRARWRRAEEGGLRDSLGGKPGNRFAPRRSGPSRGASEPWRARRAPRHRGVAGERTPGPPASAPNYRTHLQHIRDVA